MKTVTRWTHPSTDSALILEGTPAATRVHATDYFPDSPELLEGKQEQMTEEDFDALAEFEG